MKKIFIFYVILGITIVSCNGPQTTSTSSTTTSKSPTESSAPSTLIESDAYSKEALELSLDLNGNNVCPLLDGLDVETFSFQEIKAEIWNDDIYNFEKISKLKKLVYLLENKVELGEYLQRFKQDSFQLSAKHGLIYDDYYDRDCLTTIVGRMSSSWSEKLLDLADHWDEIISIEETAVISIKQLRFSLDVSAAQLMGLRKKSYKKITELWIARQDEMTLELKENLKNLAEKMQTEEPLIAISWLHNIVKLPVVSSYDIDDLAEFWPKLQAHGSSEILTIIENGSVYEAKRIFENFDR